MASTYEEVSYPSAVYSLTHPGFLAAIAILLGMRPAPVERCRVLELGGNDGMNLITMANGLPDSEFVGLDFAAAPVARGTAMIEKLGLRNVSLQVRDVGSVGAEIGQFDYIIAHGLYSWVPAPVRAKIMELCTKRLSPQGVAYISYNAYPGNHIRDLTRAIFRYHVARFSDPMDQVGQARVLLKTLAGAGDPEALFQRILIHENERLEPCADTYFFHDDLDPNNQPFYFHEFMMDAHRHGLQFLGEADVAERCEREYPPEVEALFAQLDPNDVVAGEQYRDFLRGRAFRRTLLCHAGISLQRTFDPAFMRGLFVTGQIRPAGETPGAGPEAVELFKGSRDSEFETDRPLVKAALRRIGARWPAFISFADLLAQARQDMGRSGDEGAGADADDLAMALWQGAMADGLELRAHAPQFVWFPGDRPMASALARLQNENCHWVSTLFHTVVQINDEQGREFLSLLDGNRDRRALREEVQAAIARRQAGTPAAGQESVVTNEDVENGLRMLARLGLLVA